MLLCCRIQITTMFLMINSKTHLSLLPGPFHLFLCSPVSFSLALPLRVSIHVILVAVQTLITSFSVQSPGLGLVNGASSHYYRLFPITLTYTLFLLSSLYKHFLLAIIIIIIFITTVNTHRLHIHTHSNTTRGSECET